MKMAWKSEAEQMSGLLPEGTYLMDLDAINEEESQKGVWWKLVWLTVQGERVSGTAEDGLYFYGGGLPRAAWVLSMLRGRELQDGEDVTPKDIHRKRLRVTVVHETRTYKGKPYVNAKVTYDGYAAIGPDEQDKNREAAMKFPAKGKGAPSSDAPPAMVASEPDEIVAPF